MHAEVSRSICAPCALLYAPVDQRAPYTPSRNGVACDERFARAAQIQQKTANYLRINPKPRRSGCNCANALDLLTDVSCDVIASIKLQKASSNRKLPWLATICFTAHQDGASSNSFPGRRLCVVYGERLFHSLDSCERIYELNQVDRSECDRRDTQTRLEFRL